MIGSNDSAIIWDELATLKRLQGDRELLAEMIGLFIKNAPGRLSELKRGLENSDSGGVADAAHAIKGMASHFYAEQLNHQAAQLERLARQDEIALIRLNVPVLEKALHRLINALVQSKRTLT